MNRVYITGDIHGDPSRLSINSFVEQKELDKNDYVIIAGDFGLIWSQDPNNKNEKYWLNWLDNKPFTTLFVDGNHENFDRLNNFPISEWKGGRVHKIRESVIHLMRDEFLYVNKFKCFHEWDELLNIYKNIVYNIDTEHKLNDPYFYHYYVKKEAILKEICSILEQELEYKLFLKTIKHIENIASRQQITNEKFYHMVKKIKFKTKFDYEAKTILDIINSEIYLKNINDGQYYCKNNIKLTGTNYRNLQNVSFLLSRHLVSE